MTGRTLQRLDATAVALLLLWTGMGLGFAWLVPGEAALSAARRLDLAAWFAFGGAGACAWLPRLLAEIGDAEGVGPQRLWSAALLAALLMCFASAFILVPRLAALGSEAAGTKVQGLFRQMLGLRLLLALALAGGLPFLPREKAAA